MPAACWALDVKRRQTPLVQACDSAQSAPNVPGLGAPTPPSPAAPSLAPPSPPGAVLAAVVVELDPQPDASNPDSAPDASTHERIAPWIMGRRMMAPSIKAPWVQRIRPSFMGPRLAQACLPCGAGLLLSYHRLSSR